MERSGIAIRLNAVRDLHPIDLRCTPEKDGEEKTVLIEALKRSMGNKFQAARLLGISRGTVWNRMRKYDINPKRIVISCNKIRNGNMNNRQITVISNRRLCLIRKGYFLRTHTTAIYKMS